MAYSATLDATVHVAPFSHLFRTFNIIVSHVHTPCVSHIAVDYYNLAVVTGEDVVYPWEANWVKLVYIYAVAAKCLHMVTLERTIV